MQSEPSPDPTLSELKRIVAFFTWQRKLTNRMLIGTAIVLPTAILVVILAERRIDRELNTPVPPALLIRSWSEVDRAIREGDLAKAVECGETMIAKTPGYPAGHEKLGMVYVSTGDLKKADEHFAEAYRLLPTEANRQGLEAIRKRIADAK
jgi:hypothetical protein